VDKTTAMQLFRELNLDSDNSPAVRQVMIELAGQTGNVEDLEWLCTQLGSNGQSELAWRAILTILQRQDAKVIYDWANRIEQNPTATSQIVELLELAEQKAAAQKEEQLLCDLQVRLLKWYWNKGQYEQVVAYRDKLAHKDRPQECIQNALRQTDGYAVEAYLQVRQFGKMAAVVSELLKVDMLTQTSDITEMISAYFASEKIATEDKKSLLDSLAEIPISSEQNWWQNKLEQWRGLLTPNATSKPTEKK
jgi:hypothetical protein